MSETDWQPISTAPKDGTRIIVAVKRRVIGVSFWLPSSGQWWSQETARSMREPFSHWMPLPPPPSGE